MRKVWTALLAVSLLTSAGSGTLAQVIDPPDTLKDLPDDVARELKIVTKSGCKESWADPSVPKLIRNCTRVIERKNLTARQRSFAYYVRGSLKSFDNDSAGSYADYEQSIALNPSFGPAYDIRGGGANAERESAVRDYHKAIELGYRTGFGPRIMAQWRLECPTLAYRGNECLPDGGTRAGRYECDSGVQIPYMCVWKQQGQPKGLVDCEPGFEPGLGCAPAPSDPSPAIVAATPTEVPAVDAPAPGSSPLPPPPATGQNQSWFEWRPWRSKKAASDFSARPPTSGAHAPAVSPASEEPAVAATQSPASVSSTSIPPACPIDQSFGGWTIRRGSLEGIPVVTTGNHASYSGTATKWSMESLSLELIPTKQGKWLYLMLAKNLKFAGTPVTGITSHFGASIWDGATKQGFSGFENKSGGGTVYKAPFVVIGLPPFYIDEVIDKIESTSSVNFALVMPTESGQLTDVYWINPFQSSGLRAAMAAAQACAVE